MGLKPSTADPCLYYKWVEGRLVMMMSWINDNAIVGKESDSNVKTADLWMNMWDARLKSLTQEGSSFDRKCYCKATGMNSTLKT